MKPPLKNTKTQIFQGKLLKKKGIMAKIPLPKIFFASLAIGAVEIALVLLLQSKLPPEVPLYFGLPEGELQVTPSLALVIPGLLSIGVCLLNLSLTFIFTEGYLKKSLVLTSFAFSVFTTVSTLKIIFLVGSF